jgi:hypothetical protein
VIDAPLIDAPLIDAPALDAPMDDAAELDEQVRPILLLTEPGGRTSFIGTDTPSDLHFYNRGTFGFDAAGHLYAAGDFGTFPFTPLLVRSQ